MNIEIDTSILKGDAGVIAEKLQELNETMNQMNQEILSLNNMWEGVSHDEFVSQYSTDYTNMVEVQKIIANIIDCLNFAGTEYNISDNEIKSVIRSLRI